MNFIVFLGIFTRTMVATLESFSSFIINFHYLLHPDIFSIDNK